jgi:DNA-binding MarR family transcriptional regulator
MSQAQALQSLLDSVRNLNLSLGRFGEALFDDLDLPGGPRELLREIGARPEVTVPQLAALRNVSRQHVQFQANFLYDQGWVEVLENPKHARSFLYRLTKEGQKILKIVQGREAVVFGKWVQEHGATLEVAAAALNVLKLELEADDTQAAVATAKKKHKALSLGA